MRELDLNPYKPNESAQSIAARYCLDMGFPEPQPTPYVKINETVAKQIADYFEHTPSQPRNPEVLDAYAALVQEVSLQWNMLLDSGLDIEPFGDDFVPYKDSPQMMDDVFQKHLWVYDGGSDHAVLSRQENFMFRAVHDYFGHAQYGFAFGPRGEENAWVEHSKMFSPVARRAMSAETRGQNSYVNYGPNAHLPVTERPYADQKAIILPEKFCVRPELLEAYRDYPEFYPVPESVLDQVKARVLAANTGMFVSDNRLKDDPLSDPEQYRKDVFARAARGLADGTYEYGLYPGWEESGDRPHEYAALDEDLRVIDSGVESINALQIRGRTVDFPVDLGAAKYFHRFTIAAWVITNGSKLISEPKYADNTAFYDGWDSSYHDAMWNGLSLFIGLGKTEEEAKENLSNLLKLAVKADDPSIRRFKMRRLVREGD